LQEHGYLSDELHGDLSQAKREQVMKRFREAQLHILVATDVAARGLDVEGITHVFNYDIPQDVESYIHRIGRTGRAGEKGLAITLATPGERALLQIIEKGIGMSIEKKGMITGEKYSKTKVNKPKEQGYKGHKGQRADSSNRPRKQLDSQGEKPAKEHRTHPSKQGSKKRSNQRPTLQNQSGNRRSSKDQKTSSQSHNRKRTRA
jgi:ATP-dependent RNA helicase DeaD